MITINTQKDMEVIMDDVWMDKMEIEGTNGIWMGADRMYYFNWGDVVYGPYEWLSIAIIAKDGIKNDD